MIGFEKDIDYFVSVVKKEQEKDKNIVLYPAGSLTKEVLKKCDKKNIIVCDRDVNLWGNKIEEIEICSFKDVAKRYKNLRAIVLSFSFFCEIKEYLLQYVDKKQIIVPQNIKNKVKYAKQDKKNRDLENISIQNGQILSLLNNSREINLLSDSEFKIFSQSGEDGIVSYIVSKLDKKIKNKFFIEFGVENYQESNTRFLMMSRNWSGLIIDGSRKNMQEVKEKIYYILHDLKAISHFITAENINELLKQNIPQNISHVGLLSIDIDGNDYYVFDAIKDIKADILILEYNPLFGDKKSLCVPYESDFYRFEKNFTGAYFGASIKALIHKAKQKGYSFLGTNSIGSNAFFVLNEHYEEFENLSKAIHKPKYKLPTKSIDKKVLSRQEAISEIGSLPVIDLDTNKHLSVKAIYE